MRRLFAFFALAAMASCSVPNFEVLPLDLGTPDSGTAGAQALEACRDGLLSAGEADIDCGHRCDAPCAATKTCFEDDDCASAFCSAGVCTDQTCSDRLKNQDETDIDCGGGTGCARCAPGRACSDVSDCNGGACEAGKCRAPSCNDMLKNDSESDIDCGGMCGPCATGKNCNAASDCSLALCTAGKCSAQTCADGIQNQDETDIDCGGVAGCARCATTKHCIGDSDCDHAKCASGSCQPTGCSDGVLNGSETGKDCGGSCSPCADGLGCSSAADCSSKVCTPSSHVCAVASCTDGILNGSEPTVDCGSSCSTKCQIADNCKGNGDCGSGRCYNSHCAPQSSSSAPLSPTGWVATASQTFDTTTPARFGIDGDPNTHWTTGTPQVAGMWFLVDMTKPQMFFSITMTSDSQPTDYVKSLKVSSSLDGQSFTQLRTGITGEKDLVVTFGDPQYARFLKFETLDSDGGLWWRIDDLRVRQ